MSDPIVDYEARLAQAQRRAEQIRDGLDRVRVTYRGDDGRITVTVNASGNVVDLKLGPRETPGPELAEDILRTMRAAQAKLGEAVHAAMAADFAGSELLADLDRQYREAYPVPEQDRGARRTLRLGAEGDRAAAAADRPERAREPRPDGDTDYGDRNLLR
jgi:DNA-binding protein YbaB